MPYFNTEPVWVFGYGSLIYKVDFPFLRREIASIKGWQRRFWQGSHDHRGTPDAPGRVVTLLPAPGRICKGAAYLIQPKVFQHLDHREKNGYSRVETQISFSDSGETVQGLLYVADSDNPAYLGEAPVEEVARHIARSHGPSGSNREYLLKLAKSLRELNDHDEHILALESLLADSPAP